MRPFVFQLRRLPLDLALLAIFLALPLNPEILLSAEASDRIVLTGAAQMETLQGTVTTAGSPEKRKTLITSEPDMQATQICPRGRKFELTQVAGSVVTASGQHRNIGKPGQPCFFVQSFSVKEISPGRPAIVGLLKMVGDNQYAVIGNGDGKEKRWVLSQLAPGLKDLVNEVVVCDLIATSSQNGETRWVVARAFKMPEP
jgi:hypothetical protein